ncbi:MAG: FAD-dependent oxidoreductase [Pseudomonadota bacterium]
MRAAPRVAIIGAGLTGLTCAQGVAEKGISPILFDKGRGLGGRLATRRAEGGLQFDHGAPFLTPQNPGFQALLTQAEAAGGAARWRTESENAFVGLPGMTGIAKHMARGLDIRKQCRITALEAHGSQWRLAWDGGSDTFDRVILTIPAPQTMELLPGDHPLAQAMSHVVMEPCLTLMVGLPRAEFDVPATQKYPHPDIALLIFEGEKPGRSQHMICLTAHASPAFSRKHLECSADEIEALMLPLVLDVIGTASTDQVAYASTHRWRYARAATPLGQPYLANETQTLFVGGDWCLGQTAEDAWSSGKAIGAALPL